MIGPPYIVIIINLTVIELNYINSTKKNENAVYLYVNYVPIFQLYYK